MYHTIIIAGRLGKDPEMRYSPDGKAVTNFSVAVDDGYGDRKSTIWFRVSAWEKQAETCNQYLKKGSKVLVEGRLSADKQTGGPKIWQGQNGAGANFEIVAQTVRFLSDKGEAQAQEETDEAAPAGQPQAQRPTQTRFDQPSDVIPF